jgi:DNA-binding CsgD family transcriptional regulator
MAEHIVAEQERRRNLPTLAGPSSFEVFDNIPEVFAFAIGEGGAYLWQGRHLQEHLRVIFGHNDAPTIRDYLGETLAEERLGVLQPVLEDGRPITFFEMLQGVRRRTRAWKLDPKEFGKHGWFVVISPEVRRASDTDQHRTLRGGVLGDLTRLTARELIVLRRTAEGLSASEVARLEFRSVKTIENQLQAIHAKLGLANRAELVRHACERGLLAFTPEEWSSIVEQASNGLRSRPATEVGACEDDDPTTIAAP